MCFLCLQIVADEAKLSKLIKASKKSKVDVSRRNEDHALDEIPSVNEESVPGSTAAELERIKALAQQLNFKSLFERKSTYVEHLC